MTLFILCVSVTKKESEEVGERALPSRGPSPNVEAISMQMLRSDLEEAAPAVVRRGNACLAFGVGTPDAESAP